MSFASDLHAQLEQLTAQNLRRQRRTLSSPQGPVVSVDGRELVNFCSNDYLGLANHPEMAAAASEAALAMGGGSGAAHLVCGHSSLHAELERALAQFVGRQRALLFSTGYMANLGTIAALVGRGDSVLQDKLCHASLIDGAQLSGAKLRRFRHLDAAHLAELLPAAAGRKLIVTDGVFSMDGDVAPLTELAELAQASGAWLMVDDAHGVGVLGESGQGLTHALGLDSRAVPVLVGTLGKAFGGFGAFVAGDELLIETLINRARPYIYTTALPPAAVAADLAGLALAQREGWRRQHLAKLIDHFKRGAASLNQATLLPSDTPIQPLILGEPARAVAAQTRLAEAGYWVSAIRPPTVPVGTARLRVTLSAGHSLAQVDGLLNALEEALERV